MSRHIHYLRHGIEENCIKFIELMAIEGFPVLVTETTRTDAEQYQHYLNGASQAKTPSFHAEHAGLAFDICKNAKGQEYSDERFWEAAGRVGKAMGFTWGGDWDKFHRQAAFSVGCSWEIHKRDDTQQTVSTHHAIVYWRHPTCKTDRQNSDIEKRAAEARTLQSFKRD